MSLGFFSPLLLSLSVYLDNLLVYSRWSLGENMIKIADLCMFIVLSSSMSFYLTRWGWY
jgi:hypothetical protein